MGAGSFHYGGQAVIQGVMIRGKEGVTISVRQPNGQLNVVKQPLAKVYKGRLRETPLIRGIIVLVETLVLGTQSPLHSAQIAAAEESEQKIPIVLIVAIFVFALVDQPALWVRVLSRIALIPSKR